MGILKNSKKDKKDSGSILKMGAADVSAEMGAGTLHLSEQPDRAAALETMGLDEKADAQKIDNRFWLLTKRYRAQNNDDMLMKLTQAYEVASGRAAAKKDEETLQQQAPKYFGKSARQWNVFFYYAWWKILLLVLCAVLGSAFLYQMITKRDYDIKITCIGHFTMNNTALTDYSISKLGYKNPYISSADLIADESEQMDTATIYGAAAAAAYLGLEPDVIIFDAKTMPYYLSAVIPLDDFYASLQTSLPKSVLDKITPLTDTMKMYYKRTAVAGEKVQIRPEDETEHIYGLQISDPELIRALGFSNAWKSQKASLVFSVSGSSKNLIKAKEFIAAVLRDQSEIIAKYEADNPADTASAEASASASASAEASASAAAAS